jgi:putative ABC transport system permease protein
MSVVVRATAPPLSMANAVRNEVWALDRNLPVSNLKTMEQRLARPCSAAVQRFVARPVRGAGAAAGRVGIYGVISYTVQQRSHEIGVRMALGASMGDILKLVVGQGLALTLAGVALDSGSFGLTRLISGLLFELKATDPWTFVLTPALWRWLRCWPVTSRATRDES